MTGPRAASEVPTHATIREARDSEFTAIGALLIAAYREFEPKMSADDWTRLSGGLAVAPSLFSDAVKLVADIDGELAGFVAYIPPGFSDERMFGREWASIRMLGIALSARGQGLGRLLTEACVARARGDGARVLGLHTSEAMAAARRIYEAMGLRELAPLFGLRDWSFRKELMEA